MPSPEFERAQRLIELARATHKQVIPTDARNSVFLFEGLLHDVDLLVWQSKRRVVKAKEEFEPEIEVLYEFIEEECRRLIFFLIEAFHEAYADEWKHKIKSLQGFEEDIKAFALNCYEIESKKRHEPEECK